MSGGADSLALLVLAVETGHQVHAVHVDHGLRPESSAEAAIVEAAAVRFGARFSSVSVSVPAGPNLEARARTARYDVLPADALTGHTADDQAETVLLHLLRGSGLTGASGIGQRRGRPLLDLRRADTEAVCVLAGLEPVRDPSNSDPAHLRNRVRHEVLPLLDEITDRDVVPLLVRHGELAAEGAAALDAAVADVDPTDTRAVAKLPEALQRVAVRGWLRRELPETYPIDRAATDRVLRVVAHEIRATEIGGGWRVARTDGSLRVEPPAR